MTGNTWVKVLIGIFVLIVVAMIGWDLLIDYLGQQWAEGPGKPQ